MHDEISQCTQSFTGTDRLKMPVALNIAAKIIHFPEPLKTVPEKMR
jgi:hypothetical protein